MVVSHLFETFSGRKSTLVVFCALFHGVVDVLSMSTIIAITTFNASQLSALQRLYEGAGGWNWTWRTPFSTYGQPWNFSIRSAPVNPCSEHWQGVNCTIADVSGVYYENVAILVLPSYNLVGTLTSDISLLTTLQVIDLGNNALRGTIPTSLGSLGSLECILLDGNLFTGSIPASITELSALYALNLQQNYLSSSIPTHIGKLSSLQYLLLSNNQLTGSIPASTYQLFNLYVFELQSNSLTGSIAPELGQLWQLSALSWATNLLSGSIPLQIGNITMLLDLILWENQLTGSIPASIGALSPLENLYLYSNSLSGSLPTMFGQWSGIENIDVSYNRLSGFLPVDFWDMRAVSYVKLQENYLSGTLSPAFTELELLGTLLLASNAFSGTISSTINQLEQLMFVDFSDNILTGTLPVEIGSMVQLISFSCTANELRGTIPAEFGQLINLQALFLPNNHFSGTLLSTIGNLRNLTLLYVGNNKLTGTIPMSLYSNTQLTVLDIRFNLLTGTIATEIGQLVNLEVAYLYCNHLTGILPHQFGQLTRLIYLTATTNLLSGTLPPSLGLLINLLDVDFSVNMLSGSIPKSLTNISDLESLSLDQNSFTGTLPMNIGFDGCWKNMVLFDVSSNLLTGSIPSGFVHLEALQYLIVVSNALVGPVSTVLSLPSVLFVDLGTNVFSGTVGSMFAISAELQFLRLAANVFTGPISSLVNVDIQKALAVIDVSENALTGTLPPIYGCANLVTFVAAVNCIRTPLSDAWCSNPALETLVLDGLNSATSCQQRSTRRFISVGKASTQALSVRLGVVSDIPPCLFNMSSLQTLHLAGNGIEGSLPELDDIHAFGPLHDLSLSHNQLSGSIPGWMWRTQWSYWGLSFNRLYGELPSVGVIPNIANNATVYLDINRLSGTIPSVFKDVDTIILLNGNIFGCDVQRSSLPVHDPDYRSYQCGSDSANVSIMVWFGGALVLFAILVVCLMASQNGRKTYRTVGSAIQFMMVGEKIAENERPDEPCAALFRVFMSDLRFILSRVLMLLLVVLVVMLPVYAGLSSRYGAYEHQYIWTVSACYLEGLVSAVVLLVCFAVFIVSYHVLLPSEGPSSDSRPVGTSSPVVDPSGSRSNIGSVPDGIANRSHTDRTSDGNSTSSFTITRTTDSSSISNSEEERQQRSHRLSIPVRLIKLLLVTCNVVFVVAVNAVYVYGLMKQLRPANLVLATLALSCFKIVWGWFIIHHLDWLAWSSLAWFTGSSSNTTSIGVAPTAMLLRRGKCFGIRLTTSLVIFNNVIAPYFADMFVSSNCFQYVFTSVPAVSSQYNVNYLSDFEFGSLTVDSTNTINFQPSFSYDYLCSSSLVTSFAFVFILRYLLSSLVIPSVVLLWQQAGRSAYRVMQAQQTSSSTERAWTWFERWNEELFRWIPSQHRPLEWIIAAQSKHAQQFVAAVDTQNPIIQRSNDADDCADTNKHSVVEHAHTSSSFDGSSHPPSSSPSSIVSMSMAEAQKEVVSLAVFVPSRKEVIVRVVSDVSLFLTYGLLFPPLAVIIVFALAVETRMIEHQWTRILDLLHLVRSSGSSSSVWTGSGWHKQAMALVKDFLRFRRGVFPALRRLDVMACLFWSFTLFDTLGGSTGAVGASWVAVVMGTCPGWLWCAERALGVCQQWRCIVRRMSMCVFGGNSNSNSNGTSSSSSTSSAAALRNRATSSTRESERKVDSVDGVLPWRRMTTVDEEVDVELASNASFSHW